MNCGSATGFEPLRCGGSGAPGLCRAGAALCLALALLVPSACSTARKPSPKTLLTTTQGEAQIQVVESEENGIHVVRVNTRYKGEDRSIAMRIDEPIYDVEVPLTPELMAPRAAAGGPEGQFESMLIAQYLEKAQESMLGGNYLGALAQVNLVLVIRPDHVQAHAMKGSVYYAIGSYDLAKEEWQRTLELDPSNEEVRDFMDFVQHSKASPQPPLPGSRKAAPGAAAPKGAAEGQPSAEGQPAAQGQPSAQGQPAAQDQPASRTPTGPASAQPRQGGTP